MTCASPATGRTTPRRQTRPPRPSVRELAWPRVRALARPESVVGSALEAVWATTHVALYPFGTRAPRRGATPHGYRLEPLSPVQRGQVVSHVAEAGTPILLLHGVVDNQSIFTLLRRGLQRRGFSRVYAMNYSVRTADVRTAAAQLAQEIDAIVEESGYERIHVVAHSLGGIIARYYVTRLGGDERVHTLVTLGSPHHGTYLAHLLPTGVIGQLRPGSPLLTELNRPAPGCRTRVISIWSDTDQAVLPAEHAALEQEGVSCVNIPLRGVGHMTLPILPSVVHEIATRLTHLDSDGAQTGSVTDLTVV